MWMRHATILRMRIRIGIIAALLAAGAARADRRSFVRAYEYATQPQGNLEVEIWTELEAPKTDFAQGVFTHRLELEYGLTDHWDVALYHVFEHGGPEGDPAATAFHFDSFRLETRYRLAEKGEWPIDVMLYLEGERPSDLHAPFELEEKLILEKDFGKIGLVLNLVGEQKLLRADLGRKWEVDLGARYEVAPALRVAAEVWNMQTVVGPVIDSRWFAGPSLSVATSRVWLQLGAGLGLGDNETRMQFRSVIGFNL